MFEEFPVFSFGNYSLREINPKKDAELFYKYINQEEVSDFIGSDSVPDSVDQAYSELNYWSNLFNMRRSYYWAIANEEDEI
ncbi:MAG: hypothetical protein SFT91_01565, partial [Rickettsiaceae bacterium]|nr:hypothetical protein [Rickettsiaceae bacterium]